MRTVARESARLQRQAEAAQRQHVREQERQRRESLRLTNQLLKTQRQEYFVSRKDEAEAASAQLQERMEELQSLLEARLSESISVSFASLRLAEVFKPFSPPSDIATPEPAPTRDSFLSQVRPRSAFEKLFFLKARFERQIEQAEQQFQDQHKLYLDRESERTRSLEQLKAKHEEQARRHLDDVLEKCRD